MQLLDDVVDILVSGLEIHGPYSNLSSNLAFFLVRLSAHVFFTLVPQDLTLFRIMSRSVQHAHFGRSQIVA